MFFILIQIFHSISNCQVNSCILCICNFVKSNGQVSLFRLRMTCYHLLNYFWKSSIHIQEAGISDQRKRNRSKSQKLKKKIKQLLYILALLYSVFGVVFLVYLTVLWSLVPKYLNISYGSFELFLFKLLTW